MKAGTAQRVQSPFPMHVRCPRGYIASQTLWIVGPAWQSIRDKLLPAPDELLSTIARRAALQSRTEKLSIRAG